MPQSLAELVRSHSDFATPALALLGVVLGAAAGIKGFDDIRAVISAVRERRPSP